MIKILTEDEVKALWNTAMVLAWAAGSPPPEIFNAHTDPKWLEAAYECLVDITRHADEAGL
jgi:hypothetical protein